MLKPQIRRIEVQGFRSFGAATQSAEIDAPIAVLWGQNSKGKTSLAEAVEFLLTGQTVKRELMASRHAEFADALRHAHLNDATETYVAAMLDCPDGTNRVIKRTLVRDYGKQGACVSSLTIDGFPATEDDLARLGIVLSQPPLRAPVLAQHTLNYLFTVRPTDRSTYFKALLEVTDLDELRTCIAALEERVTMSEDPLLSKLDVVRTAPSLGLSFIGEDLTRKSILRNIFDAAARDLLEGEDIEVPALFEECVDALDKRLQERRAQVFPIDLFSRKSLVELVLPTESDWAALEKYLIERSKVQEQVRHLTGLFETVLHLPQLRDVAHPVDCPVCETKHALTPERIEVLRKHVVSNAAFTNSENEASIFLRRMQSNVSTLEQGLKGVLPAFIREGSTARRNAGFTVEKMVSLLGEDTPELVAPFLRALRPFLRAHRAVQAQTKHVKSILSDLLTAPSNLESTAMLREQLRSLGDSIASWSDADTSYADRVTRLYDALKTAVDVQGVPVGWQEFVELSRDLPALREAVVERTVRKRAQNELESALRQIDNGIEAVLDKKFALLTEAVNEWWSLLRGGESTFFSAVERRGRQTIDIKGGLSQHEDQTDPKIRDVIAIFSDSQLHCLGLALFLARAQHYGTSFIVLDDPVLTSDENYRIHFRERVVAKLHERGIQTVILTQHRATRRDIATLHGHVDRKSVV